MVSVPHVHQDDVVEYRLFPVLDEGLTEETAIAQALEECLDLYLAHLSPFLVDYIWQSEPFRLQSVDSDSSCNVPCHLFGATHFGDNIEDEWFIVFLLHQLTTAFPGLLASIQDSDGNFLLIEAAYHLPKWLNPETSANRVFIYNGELHVIPMPNNPAELTTLPGGVPSMQQAVDLVRGEQVVTQADKHIREDIQNRISKFPDKIKEDLHYSHCFIPARLAMVIRHKPSLIAAAIQAFYQRDPIDLRACRVMKYFPPEDMVISQVKFTRCLYAQLTQQKFHPDQRSGWRVPAQSNPRYKACSLGMKLAHGFEILCSRCMSSNTAAATAANQDEGGIDVTSGVRWKRYLDSLSKKGYFRGELEGSKLYTELFDSAKKFFTETISTLSREDSSNMGHQIIEILQTVPCDAEAWKASERNLPPSQDDSWLDLTPDQLDKMLEEAAGKHHGKQPSNLATHKDGKSDGNTVEAEVDLESVAKGIKTFVDKVSSFEGAEFPKGFDDAPIKFDASMFEDALENILSYRRAGPADDSDDSEDDDDDDDDDFDFEDDESGEMKPDDMEMLGLMDQMDRELAGTEIGKSFERENEDDNAKDGTSQDKPKMAGSSAGASGSNHSHTGEEEEDHRPVEVDVNLLKNMIESYSSQQGLAGPASNILHSMGVHLPQDADKTS